MGTIPTLIADDSAMIVKIIKKALLANTIDGFHFEENQIFTAADGMEAFELMASEPSIKLIISDINMPNLNGDEFVEILQDTNKIDDINILFVTATTTNMNLKPEVKDKILGIIYKPFNIENFNEKMHFLHVEKEKRDKEIIKIKSLHVEQKQKLYKISKKYLEHFSILLKEKVLNSLIDENFSNIKVLESEYIEIIHSALSLYMFEIETEHTVDTKRLSCIIKSMNNTKKLKANRLALISGFKDMLSTINDEELRPKELLSTITTPLIEKISLTFAKVKKYPKQSPQRFSDQFSYIIDEFSKIDCDFNDEYIQRLLLDLQEFKEFKKYFHNFLAKDMIATSVTDVKRTPVLYNEIIKRLKYAYTRNNLLLQHYTGELDSYIWKRAKQSKEILNYLQKNLKNKIFNSAEFLLYKEKSTSQEYKRDYKLDRQNIIVISNNLNTLENFKEITEQPFDNWHFYAFAQINMLDAWLNSNEAHLIIIDYGFTTSVINNGMQFIRLRAKKNLNFQKVINNNKLFFIATNEEVVQMQKDTNNLNYTLIDDKLIQKDICKTLINN